jgi:hypothetical protein
VTRRRNEALRGQEEGRKDRPCVIVLAVENDNGQTLVTVAPITHAPPRTPDIAVEVPAGTKSRLGLDDEPSWIIAADLNQFIWPGVDLRTTAPGKHSYSHGLLPAALYRELRDKVLALARAGRAAITPRAE